MGDHRASVKIEFSMYGETKKADMWINWSPDGSECQDIDQRVIDFFQTAYRQMYAKYWDDYEDALEKERQQAERKEYERLKTKFEGAKNA